MNMKTVIKRCFICAIMMSFSVLIFAQGTYKSPHNADVLLTLEIVSETEFRLINVKNNGTKEIIIFTKKNGEETKDIILGKNDTEPFGEDWGLCDGVFYRLDNRNGSKPLWIKKDTKREWEKIQKKKNKARNAQKTEEDKQKKFAEKILKNVEKRKEAEESEPVIPQKKEVGSEIVIPLFIEKLEKDAYFSNESIENDDKRIKDHIRNVRNWENKKQYIDDEKLREYISNEGEKLEQCKREVDAQISSFFTNLEESKNYIIKDSICTADSIKNIFSERLARREEALDSLVNVCDSIENSSSDSGAAWFDANILVEIIVVVCVVVILFIWFTVFSKRRSNRRKQAVAQSGVPNDEQPTIVVRRKTTSILKKQSLDDVVANKAYMKIECSDFCDDSAVKCMYIKNSCIKDIYNMYADDLRNPENPKEDGCMVLGRWLHDEKSNEYSVSLEEIVKPGDDAVFHEYELNFGGKIKLRVAEKLRKLRRDTDLQYDLTCWVHSHPGLGVFFSNSDCGVQMQLKHPTHPNFLTAIVVDILTPQQEFGIFTFKHDATINSKNDLKRMYSLEELHKWAVESERHSYKPEDYYNSLFNAATVSKECGGVQLSNGAIIDLSSIVTEQNSGLAGLAYGYPYRNNDKNEFVVNSICMPDKKTTDNELMGCLVVGTHCSIPSIRKAVAEYMNKIKFVMFYSVKDESVTTIPVINMLLSMDEKYYAEEKLEDLKIWTRRKR